MNALLAQVRAADPGTPAVLDVSGVERVGSLEAAQLVRLVTEGRQRGVTVLLSGLSAEAQQALRGVSPRVLDLPPPQPRPPFLERLGAVVLGYISAARSVLQLVGEFVYFTVIASLRGKPVKWDRTAQQVVRIGADGVPIVSFLSFLIGVVLGLNGAAQLRQFGATIYVADLVGVAMTREMAPLITAVIIAGRSGSAITAELGTMIVSEEVDAMRTMALSPARYLLVPRLLGLLISLPCLTLISDLAGICGGCWVGVLMLRIGTDAYLIETGQALLVRDVIMGLVKSAVFALIIGLVACYRGFHVRGGAEGVGVSTTSSVVTSIVLCIVANAVFTTIFYYLR